MGVKNNEEKQEGQRSSEKQQSENKTPIQAVENLSGSQAQGIWLQQARVNPGRTRPEAILSLQRKAGNRSVQRAIRGNAGDAAITDQKGNLKDYISEEIKRARAGGQPLDKNVQREMGQGFGHDFSGVRIHTDERSNQLNRQLNARAFTLGNSIFFSSGAYSPSTPQGKNTLKHELTHVVQQGGKSPGSGPLQLGGRETGHEKEAEQVAVGRSQAAVHGSDGVQRQPALYASALQSGGSLAGGMIQRAGLWDRIKSGAQTAISGIGQRIGGLFAGNAQPVQPPVQQQQGQNPQVQVPVQQQQGQNQQAQAPVQQPQNQQQAQQPTLPEKPSDVNEAQWQTLVDYGVPDKAAWNKLTGPMKVFVKTNISESYTKALVLEGIKGTNNDWPKDENNAAILMGDKISFITNKTGLSFAEWNAINKTPERKFLLANYSGNESLMGKLAQAAKTGTWPKDDADQPLQNVDKIKFITNKSGINYAEWNALDKDKERKFILTHCTSTTDSSLMAALAQAAKAGAWPKDGNDEKLQDKTKIAFINQTASLKFTEWNALEKDKERKFLLDNFSGNEGMMGELARTARASAWPKDENDEKFGDLAKLKIINDELNIRFTRWNTKILKPYRKMLFDAKTANIKFAEKLVSAAPGAWPMDGAGQKMTDYADKWERVMKAVPDISVKGWNNLPASVRGQALAEADDTKRKNLVGQYEYEKYSKGMDVSDKVFNLINNPITDTATGVGGLTGDILGATGLDRAAGITGATTNAVDFGKQTASGIQSIVNMSAGGSMWKNGRSESARKIGKKRAMGGITGAVSSGLGMLGSMFGFGGNLAKGIDPDSDASKGAQAGLGVTSGVFGTLGSAFSGAMDIKGLVGSSKRAGKAKNFSSGVNAINATDMEDADKQKLSGISSLTSKRQNIGGRVLGMLGSGIGLLGSIHGIVASATGYKGSDITSAVFSGLGLLTGLGKTGYEYTAKADDVDVDAKAQELIDLLKGDTDAKKQRAATEAAKFVRDVLNIKNFPANQVDWIKWIEEDEGAFKDLIKSKLSKN